MTASSGSITTSSTAVTLPSSLPLNPIQTRLDVRTAEVARRCLAAEQTATRLLSPLGAQWKKSIVSGIATGVYHLYIDAERAQAMAGRLTSRYAAGAYDSLSILLSKKPMHYKCLLIC